MDSRIYIVSTVRDSSKTLSENVKRLSDAFSDFGQIRWIVVESDSTDSTNEKLKRISEMNSHFHYISLGNLEAQGLSRTQRIAESRNRGLEMLFAELTPKPRDFIVLADLDGRNNLLNKRAVTSCWALDTDWDVCTANQFDYYYDIWALRHPQWSPVDCFLEYNDLIEQGFDKKVAYELAVKSKMIFVNPSTPPIRVRSAFGGLAIYKANLLREVRYLGIGKNGMEQCDHVDTNEILNDAGFKILINPRLLNSKSETSYGRIRSGLNHRINSVQVMKHLRTIVGKPF